MVGPGVLAGLSDDDPAGITTYSLLGAEYGYELIWVLVLSTAALVVFHELGVRLGIVTGKGLLTLVRERYGQGTAAFVLAALVVANTGTLCAEFAGVAAAMELLTGTSRYLSVPVAATAVTALVLRENFRHVEHFLLALSSVFVAYVVSGLLAHPDWGEAAKGAAVPSIPLTRDALLVAVATVGTTLAPWGLAFIQSYAVDKRLTVRDLRYERVDVVVGAVLTGVIGVFVVVACAATLHSQGVEIDDARDAAQALEPLAGSAASSLFGLGFLGAALLAAAIVPLSTAYSISETLGRKADLDDSFSEARAFYLSFAGITAVAVAVVLIPGISLVPVLFLTQALNAVLLLVMLPFMRRLGRDRELMGEHALGRAGRWATGVALAAIVVSVLALAALAGCGGNGDGGDRELTVLGASSLTEALDAYGSEFEGASVRASFAGSDQLAAQVRQGVRADVFASADRRYPAELHREGLAGKPVVFARNRLVAVTPPGSPIGSLATLAEPGTKIVVGDPDVPVGRYTREVLDRLPASRREAILANVRSEEPEVSSVLAKVVNGAADAGFVYVTDARTVGGEVRTLPIPPRLQPDVEYAAVVLGAGEQKDLARRYVEGLLRGAGAAALREAGFLPPR